MQGSLSNFAGGVLILLLKPFVLGDYIIDNTTGEEGTVSNISIFIPDLKQLIIKVVLIPNGKLSDSVHYKCFDDGKKTYRHICHCIL